MVLRTSTATVSGFGPYTLAMQRLAIRAALGIAAATLLTACWPVVPPGSNLRAAICAGTTKGSSSAPLTNPALRELSGIVASRTQSDVWYAHNDSGDTNRFFAFNSVGTSLATFTVTGANAIDWEDIAIGPGPTVGVQYLYLADIGDNSANRSTVQVYRIPEPSIPAANGSYALSGAATLQLQYPDGPRDSEALIVDPRNGQLSVIEKKLTGGAVGVYRAAPNLADGSTTVMTRVMTLPLGAGPNNAVTGADMSANSEVVVLRTYGQVRAYLISNPTTTTIEAALLTFPCSVTVPSEIQGEAVGIRANSTGLVTVAEGTNPTLHFLDA